MLWIVDGGMLTLPVLARVEDWQDGEFIDITTGDEDGEWNESPTRYAVCETCHDKGGIDDNGNQVFCCSACGCVLSLTDSDGSNTLCTSFIYDYPRFCPECGAKVVDA